MPTSISLEEIRKDITKTLELPGNSVNTIEVSTCGSKVAVVFRFNMRGAITNPTIFELGSDVMKKYKASLSVHPLESRYDGLSVELRVSMSVDEVKS